MSLTNESTDAEVLAQWENNADYDYANNGEGSVAKARLRLQAGRFLQTRSARVAQHGVERTELDTASLQDDVRQVQMWLQANGGSGSTTTHAGFQDFRRGE